eukprot:8182257-Lingulodinium_polyedra.AAC.1
MQFWPASAPTPGGPSARPAGAPTASGPRPVCARTPGGRPAGPGLCVAGQTPALVGESDALRERAETRAEH